MDGEAAVPALLKRVKFDGVREGPRPRGPQRGGFSAESFYYHLTPMIAAGKTHCKPRFRLFSGTAKRKKKPQPCP